MHQLSDLKVGQSATIETISAEGALKRRLMDMGLTKGTRVTIRRLAPLGDPMSLFLRGYELTLRRQDAAIIAVKEVL